MEHLKHFPTVNRKLLPVKFHYFFFMAALACGLPFRTVFAKQIGLSGTEIGVIFCVFPFLRIVSNPFFGFILDYFKKFRLTISLTLIIVAVSHVCLIFIPTKTTSEINLTDGDFYTRLEYSCQQSKTIPNVCDLKMVMYNKYRLADRNIFFACNVDCIKSAGEIRITSENKNCSEKLISELSMLINVSVCDIDIQLKRIKVVDMNNSSWKIELANLNNSFVKTKKSWILTANNCFFEQNTSAVVFKQIRELNQIDDYSDDFEKHTTVFRNFSHDQKTYSIMHDFTIYNLSHDLLSDDCSLEYKCKTKKCFSRTQLSLSDLENVTAEKDEFLSIQFWSTLLLFTIACVTFGDVMFMMDAVCYELLQGKGDQFGQQRLWGTISWGLGCLAGGFLNQIASTSTVIDYALSFYLLAFLIFIDILAIYHLKVTDVKHSPNIMKDVCLLFSNLEILYNLIVVCIIGALSGFLMNYEFWFMQEIGSSQVLLGLSHLAESIFELPCFVISGWMINKIGHAHCNSITLLCFGLRYLCFVFMYNPWWTLAAASLYGPTFGLFYASMTMYAKNKAPPGTEATVQSLLHLSYEGIGVSAGSMLGGIGLDKLGSRTSFMYAAVLSFILLFVNVLMIIFFSKSKKKSAEVKSIVT